MNRQDLALSPNGNHDIFDLVCRDISLLRISSLFSSDDIDYEIGHHIEVTKENLIALIEYFDPPNQPIRLASSLLAVP